jgi:hypothetical protein
MPPLDATPTGATPSDVHLKPADVWSHNGQLFLNLFRQRASRRAARHRWDSLMAVGRRSFRQCARAALDDRADHADDPRVVHWAAASVSARLSKTGRPAASRLVAPDPIPASGARSRGAAVPPRGASARSLRLWGPGRPVSAAARRRVRPRARYARFAIKVQEGTNVNPLTSYNK